MNSVYSTDLTKGVSASIARFQKRFKSTPPRYDMKPNFRAEPGSTPGIRIYFSIFVVYVVFVLFSFSLLTSDVKQVWC